MMSRFSRESKNEIIHSRRRLRIPWHIGRCKLLVRRVRCQTRDDVRRRQHIWQPERPKMHGWKLHSSPEKKQKKLKPSGGNLFRPPWAVFLFPESRSIRRPHLEAANAANQCSNVFAVYTFEGSETPDDLCREPGFQRELTRPLDQRQRVAARTGHSFNALDRENKTRTSRVELSIDR